MKKTLVLCIAVILLPIVVLGQKKEFTIPYKYTASNDDSRNSAKTKAMEEAQASLLQQLGVLVEARQKMTTNVSGNNKQEDFVEELKTYTIGKVQTQIVDGTEKFAENDKGDMVYSATFKMLVDTVDLYKYLDNIVKQKEQARIDDIKKQQKIQTLRKETEELKKQVETAKARESDLLKTLIIAQKRFAELKTQKDAAEQDYKSTLTASNASSSAGMAKTRAASNYLAETTNQYNSQEAECKKLENAYAAAQKNTETAENNLYNAEVLLANETGAPKPEKQTVQNKPATVTIEQTAPAPTQQAASAVAVTGAAAASAVNNNTVTATVTTLGTILSGANLAAKLDWLDRSAESHNTYILDVTANENIAPRKLNYSGAINITVILMGDGTNRYIRLSSNGTMFTVYKNVTFVLDNNVTLQGHSQNTNSLVDVNGGIFKMNLGSTVTGNERTGVYLSDGSFIMTGGTISNNSHGVYTTNGTTFTMTDGTISGNSASSGGGVYMDRGKFEMTGGIISNNNASNAGGGVSVGSFTTFNMRGGTISGNTAGGYGGGVYVSTGFEALFKKTGGTITGYSSDPSNGNVVKDVSGTLARRGHAVYNGNSSTIYRRKETTAGPKINLSTREKENWDE